MKSLKNTFGLIAVFVAIILSQGCATIFGGRTNTMVFTSNGELQADVFIDDSLVGQSPGEIVLPKQVIQHGSILEIRAEGYETQEYLILRKPHTWYILSDFIVGGIPLIVDYATGNILRPSPRKLEVDLTKQD